MGRVELSEYTTFNIGGTADVIEAHSREELLSAYREDAIVLGKGSNVLVSDRGVNSPVIVNRMQGVTFDGETVTADSGVSLPTLAAECARRGLSGLEWACSIPGSLGGSIKMNAGAYGSSISEVIDKVSVLRGHAIAELDKANCGFTYRGSGFLKSDVIMSATLSLMRDEPRRITARMTEFNRRRITTQPMGKSAGSVFKAADRPAGYYLDRAGLKGEGVGGAVVSEKHANFIINTGAATAADVNALMQLMQRRVYEAFGVELSPEIILLGEF